LSAHKQQSNNLVASSILAASLAFAVVSAPLPAAQAYDASDYATETVQTVVQTLKDASGNTEQTFKAFESIAAIITEGKGVGGMINYREYTVDDRGAAFCFETHHWFCFCENLRTAEGIALERGFIADEDTTLYNPGLTLLTESEKERLVGSVIAARKEGLQKGSWDENNQIGYEFLKQTLDPLHMAELSGFLGFVPIYGAVLYLGVLAVQQFSRELFPTAYLIGVVAFFAPILALAAFGPQ
jgi:hypothetical protein